MATTEFEAPDRRERRSAWRWAVGAILLLALVLTAGPRELAGTLSRVAPAWSLGVIAVASLWLFIGGLNVWILLRSLVRLPLATFLAVYVTSWGAALMIPGQLGDATQMFLLRRYGIAIEKGSAAYVVDKAISLVWMLLVATYGIALYLPEAEVTWLLPLVALAGALAAVSSLVVLRRLSPVPGGWMARLQDFVDRFLGQLWEFRNHLGSLVLNVLLTVSKWALMALLYICAFRSFGHALDFEKAGTVPVMSSLVGYIPVTIGGAGTMEWTAVMLFSRFGVGAAVVVSAFLFQRCVLILVALVFVLGYGQRLDPSQLEAAGTPAGSRADAAPLPRLDETAAPRGDAHSFDEP